MERTCESVRFALKTICTVAARRKNGRLSEAAHQLLARINGIDSTGMYTTDDERRQTVEDICFEAFFIVDELMTLTNFEIREVLFPLPEIKRTTREFGTRWSSNYFEWLSADEHYSPERLLGLLEEDLHQLEVAKALLQQCLRPGERGLQKKRRR
jgi:hypothetical protein